jgi:hypothetical protein
MFAFVLTKSKLILYKCFRLKERNIYDPEDFYILYV